VRSLHQLVDVATGAAPWPGRTGPTVAVDPGAPGPPGTEGTAPDLADVRGQQVGRRDLEVAAAGGHHLLMVGPPGSGMTMLAERLPGILAPLEPEQALEVSRVHSAAGIALPGVGLIRRPPFRAPHHGTSAASLVGGARCRCDRAGSAWPIRVSANVS